MTARTALIAGRGGLPAALVAEASEPLLVCVPEGIEPDGIVPAHVFRLERLAPFLDHLAALGIERVVMAGAMARPRLDPALIDAATARVLPRLLGAMPAGDDALLRAVVAVIEETGLAVAGAADLAPGLVPGAGVLCGAPGDGDARDADRAAAIAAALGAVDVGQGCVVDRGLCLGVEALPGTDAMLDFVAATRTGRGGLLWKAPKPGQDLRVDMPALGPATVARAAAAGLAGIAWQGGRVLCLDRAGMVAAAMRAGLFLWAR